MLNLNVFFSSYAQFRGLRVVKIYYPESIVRIHFVDSGLHTKSIQSWHIGLVIVEKLLNMVQFILV